MVLVKSPLLPHALIQERVVHLVCRCGWILPLLPYQHSDGAKAQSAEVCAFFGTFERQSPVVVCVLVLQEEALVSCSMKCIGGIVYVRDGLGDEGVWVMRGLLHRCVNVVAGMNTECEVCSMPGWGMSCTCVRCTYVRYALCQWWCWDEYRMRGMQYARVRYVMYLCEVCLVPVMVLGWIQDVRYAVCQGKVCHVPVWDVPMLGMLFVSVRYAIHEPVWGMPVCICMCQSEVCNVPVL